MDSWARWVAEKWTREREAHDGGIIRVIDESVYDSAKRPSPAIEEVFQILHYRDLVGQFVRRDIVTRYKRSVAGVAWTMLNPLGMMLVMTIAFSNVFGATRAYAAYLLTGLVAWNFFGQTTVYAMRQVVWGGALIQRIYIPKTIFIVSALGTGLVNLLLSLIPLAFIVLFSGLSYGLPVLFLPIAILLLAGFTLGVGLLLSTISLYFPDVAEMYEIVLLAWMYLTPIIYPPETIPVAYRWWLFNFNPMYHLIRLFRLALYDGLWPSPAEVGAAALIGLGTLALGWFVFTRKADEFAYRV